MNSVSKRRSARSIFLEAIESYTPAQWERFLDQACADDPGLRRRVEALLKSHQESDSLLDQSVCELGSLPISERPGTVIGAYKLLQQIGEGGFGVVYLAQQQHPVRRQVALKIVKPGADTKSVVARFDAERQALALMDHPNIARVLDAGATDTGRPYFVMDLVKGVRITEYCDKNHLGTRQRLELFATVCHAVQHAHQKGIIHRDLKPANIMVTLHDGKPVPKIIDFGVSKAVSQQLTEKTLFTAYGQMIGTPQYLSPEQAEMSGLDIDTRSDIYSLGVILYELLTGTTPLESERLRAASLSELQQMICGEEATKPSTRLSTLDDKLTIIAQHRSVTPERLRQAIQGDLDWIVMKSLEKERGRRYDSASRLAEDIEKSLRNEPIEARPPSTSYMVFKFVRRHRGSVIAALAVSIALIAGVIGTTIGLIHAHDAAAVASHQAQRATRLAREAQFAEQRASREADRYRRLSYQSDMSAALHVWQSGDVGRAADLLRRHLPSTNQNDLRRFEWYYLFGLCQRSLMTPTIQSSATCLAYSPDGKQLVIGDQQAVWLMDLESGQLTTLTRYETAVSDVIFSPDGKMIASASRIGRIRLQHLDSSGSDASLRHLSDAREGAVPTLAFSPDSSTLASSSRHGQIARLWDLQTGKLIAELPHAFPVTTAVFSQDSSMIATTDWEGALVLWNAKTHAEQSRYAAHSGPTTCLKVSPTDQRWVTGGADGSVKLWRFNGTELTWLGSLEGHTGSVTDLAFSPDGTILASGGADNTVRLWHLATQQVRDVLRGTAPVEALAFAPGDGRTLAVAARDGVKLWDTSLQPEPEILTGPTGEVCRATFSRDKAIMISCGWDGLVRLWDTDTWQVRRTLLHQGPVISCELTPDEKTLATAGAEGIIRLWSVETERPPQKLFGHPGRINSVAFSPCGALLVSAGQGPSEHGHRGTVRFWDLASMAEIDEYRYDGHPSAARKAVFSPDGKHVASVSQDGTVRLWTLGTQRERILTRGATDSWGVAFSPDGRRLVWNANREAQVYDLVTGRQLTLSGHTSPLMAVAFLPPSGNTIASTSYDGMFRLWDTATCEPQFSFPNCGTGINGFASTADGKMIALCCRDATIRLLRAATEDDVRAAGWYDASD